MKLCEKAPLVKKDKDGKEVKEEKELCLTHHERLDGNTGMVLVSAAIREIKGQPKKSLMIMVPLGMAIPPGIRAAVYTKEQWAAAAKNEKIDEKTLKPIELKYSLCHPAGCTAETEATPEILAEMAKGGGHHGAGDERRGTACRFSGSARRLQRSHSGSASRQQEVCRSSQLADEANSRTSAENGGAMEGKGIEKPSA